MTLALPEVGNALVDDDPLEPHTKCTVTPECFQFAKGFDEGLLQKAVGFILISCHAQTVVTSRNEKSWNVTKNFVQTKKK